MTSTLADDIRRKIEAEREDFLYAKSREIIRQHGGMITTEEAYRLAKEKYLPLLIKAQMDECIKRNDFDTYTLIQNLFSQEPAVKEAAWQDLKGMILLLNKENITKASGNN